jgi:hypothetical protein
MIYRNVDGNICEIKKSDVPNDTLYYKKIYENMLKIAKREELKKAFQDKEKKQYNKKNKNVTTSEVHV